jgi:STAS domain
MEEQGLVIAVRRRPRYVLVTVSGEIDIATAGQLRDRLADPAGGGQQVIIDFSRVSFIDAAGIGVLAGAAAGRSPGRQPPAGHGKPAGTAGPAAHRTGPEHPAGRHRCRGPGLAAPRPGLAGRRAPGPALTAREKDSVPGRISRR